MTVHAVHPSPIGPLLLVGEVRGSRTNLTGLYMDEHLRGPSADPAWREEPEAFTEVGRQLDDYFAGVRTAFDLPLALVGTPFQLRVWEELRRIPVGTATTYGALAARIGRPRAARAVGAGVSRNPISVIVPCHRVLGGDGSLTGFAGGLERKRWLLALEGVDVRSDGRLAAPAPPAPRSAPG